MTRNKKEHDQLEQEKDQIRKLIRIRTVLDLTSLSKSYIYDLCNRGLFPQSIQLVQGGSAVAWVKSEVLEWIDSRIQERDDNKIS